MTWILILTLIGPSNYSGSAIASVTGFESSAACLAAAEAWVDQSARYAKEIDYAPIASALCVKDR